MIGRDPTIATRSLVPHASRAHTGGIDAVLREGRQAARALRRNPGLVIGAIVSLGLGIGLNASVFSVTNAMLFKPLPVPTGSRLVQLFFAGHGQDYRQASYPDYIELRDHVRTLDGIATYAIQPASVRVHDIPEAMTLCAVSGNFFRLLAVRPARGRLILPDDDLVPGASAVAVISREFWRREWNDGPRAIGQTLVANGVPLTIIGVTQADFAGPMPGAAFDLYVPAMMRGTLSGRGATPRDLERTSRWGWMLGRLRPGTSVRAAQSELAAFAAVLGREYPQTDSGLTIRVTPARGMRPDLQHQTEPFLRLVSGIVLVVLLIACINVAGLMLARIAVREHEIAIRRSLGASHIVIARQILLESLLLAALGGLVGTVLAYGGAHGLRLLLTPPVDLGLRVYYDFVPDRRVVVFIALASLVSGLAFGIATALRATHTNVAFTARSSIAAGRRQHRIRSAVVVAQTALAVTLLLTAGVFVMTIYGALHADPGFHVEGVTIAEVTPQRRELGGRSRQAFEDALLARLRATPQLSAVGLASTELLGAASDVAVVTPPREARAPSDAEWRVPVNAVTPGTLELLGIPVLRGRSFGEEDREAAPRVAIVNRTLAHQLAPGGDVIGHVVLVDSQAVEIVGVMPDARYVGSADTDTPYMFLPYAQNRARAFTTVIYARSYRGESASAITAIRHAVRALAPDLPVTGAAPLGDQVRLLMNRTRIAATLAGVAALIALILSAAGTHALMAHSVVERFREIGIRMALGAQRSRVRGMLLGRAIVLAGSGTAAGTLLGLAVVRVVRSRLEGLVSVGPAIVVAVALLTFGVAVVATWWPAQRATRIDPMMVMRAE